MRLHFLKSVQKIIQVTGIKSRTLYYFSIIFCIILLLNSKHFILILLHVVLVSFKFEIISSLWVATMNVFGYRMNIHILTAKKKNKTFFQANKYSHFRFCYLYFMSFKYLIKKYSFGSFNLNALFLYNCIYLL